ncbi:MAG: adenylosuccinate synthase [Chlorobi bacterium]|nr:adenylosuccinate synthase [Chlorobiota bacterium]
MKVDVLLGLQWGDEGKGKIVDVLTPRYDIVARFQGGPNAGHTIEFEGKKFVLHTIPSGIFIKKSINVIGNGVIIDPFILRSEIKKLTDGGVEVGKNLLVSRKAHLIMPTHRLLDAVYEQAKGKDKIGSTLKGIGPTYTDKVSRSGLRVGDIESEEFEGRYQKARKRHLDIIRQFDADINDFVFEGFKFEEYEQQWMNALGTLKSLDKINSEYFLNNALAEGKKILAEGAQGTMLDIDFGSYPFVTSSNTTSAGVCNGLGIPPSKIGKVFGIFKAYCTRVGSGPFPTELFDADGAELRKTGNEFGATTGRPRRCGWLDLPALKYAIMLNGVTDLIMMKADVLNAFDKINIGVNYKANGEATTEVPFEFSMEDTDFKPVYKSFNGWKQELSEIKEYSQFPKALAEYVKFVETETNVPVNIISIGPDRSETIVAPSKQKGR